MGLETMSIECVVTTRYVQGWADSVCVTVLAVNIVGTPAVV